MSGTWNVRKDSFAITLWSMGPHVLSEEADVYTKWKAAHGGKMVVLYRCCSVTPPRYCRLATPISNTNGYLLAVALAKADGGMVDDSAFTNTSHYTGMSRWFLAGTLAVGILIQPKTD
jgi:hypothetical protein